MDEKNIPEEDVIDQAFLEIAHSVIGEEYDDDDLDGALDVLLSVIEELVDEDEVPEIPDVEATDEQKQEWVSRYVDTIKTAFQESVSLVSAEEQAV